MYDTIHLQLTPSELGREFEKKEIGHVYDALTNVRHNGKTWFTGKLKNLIVTMTPDRLTIKGSLIKFIRGTQLATLTPADVQTGIQELSRTLWLPIDKALVTRLDIAYNIETAYKPKAYFDFMGKLRRYKRLEQENGLYYRTQTRQVLIYDKLKELKRKGQKIPPAYHGKNLLRFEVQFLNKIEKQLNRLPVTGATLYRPDFYERMQAEWAKMYHAIDKNRTFGVMVHRLKNVKDLSLYLMLMGIQQLGGLNVVRRIIAHGKLTQHWDKQQANRLLAKLTRVAHTPHLTIVSPLVEELDQKVQELTTHLQMEAAA